MTREVRWILQASHPGANSWRNQEERVYSGWFYSVGDDKPSPTVMAEYEKAVKELDWLDVRLVQEVRSFTHTVLREDRREKKEKDEADDINR